MVWSVKHLSLKQGGLGSDLGICVKVPGIGALGKWRQEILGAHCSASLIGDLRPMKDPVSKVNGISEDDTCCSLTCIRMKVRAYTHQGKAKLSMCWQYLMKCNTTYTLTGVNKYIQQDCRIEKATHQNEQFGNENPTYDSCKGMLKKPRINVIKEVNDLYPVNNRILLKCVQR